MTWTWRLPAIVSSRLASPALTDEGQLLRLLEMVDLGGEIVPPERDAEQEFHPRHDAVTIADAETDLD